MVCSALYVFYVSVGSEPHCARKKHWLQQKNLKLKTCSGSGGSTLQQCDRCSSFLRISKVGHPVSPSNSVGALNHPESSIGWGARLHGSEPQDTVKQLTSNFWFNTSQAVQRKPWSFDHGGALTPGATWYSFSKDTVLDGDDFCTHSRNTHRC